MRSLLCSCSSVCLVSSTLVLFFFFTATPTPEIYTLSLHDALPISRRLVPRKGRRRRAVARHAHGEVRRRRRPTEIVHHEREDRKSTRLNSSHGYISYAVFCLKKKKKKKDTIS